MRRRVSSHNTLAQKARLSRVHKAAGERTEPHELPSVCSPHKDTGSARLPQGPGGQEGGSPPPPNVPPSDASTESKVNSLSLKRLNCQHSLPNKLGPSCLRLTALRLPSVKASGLTKPPTAAALTDR